MNQWRLLLCAALYCVSSVSLAQITLDGSLGPGGPLAGPDFDIGAELGQQQGGNLFHSFQHFHLQTGESATFHGPAQVNRIISRVTGGQQSQINGTLRSTIPNADLYLLNPSGVLFGPNAALDVQGGFHASTADRVQFSDGSQFNADLAHTSTLTTAAVEAFGFLDGPTQGLTLAAGSQLVVPPEQTVSLIGGNIELQQGSVIRAASGRFNVAATQGSGTVTPSGDGVTLTTQRGRLSLDNARMEGDDFVADSSRAHGTAAFYIQAGEFVMQNSAFIGSGNLIPDRAGQAIHIEAETVTLSGNSRLINITEQAGGQGGDIVVTAHRRIQLTDGETTNQRFQGTRFSTSSFGLGDGGDIRLQAQQVQVTQGARLEADSVLGQSTGGTITVNAQAIFVTGVSADGTQSQISTNSFSREGGSAGHVQLQANTVQISDGGTVSSFARAAGDGGTITMVADSLTVSGANSGILTTSEVLGNSGHIVIRADELQVTGGGQISAATGGLGQGGDIDIQVTGAVTLSGEDNAQRNSNINASGQYSPAFLAGNLPETVHAGGSGNIRLQAGSVVIEEGAQINNTVDTNGQAGNIVLAVRGPIVLTGTNRAGTLKSAISSDSGVDSSTGIAGNIILQAEQLDLRDGSQISTTSNTADGGTITLQLTGYLYAQASAITTSVGDSVGGGGNITLDSAFLVLDNSSVIARAIGGPGGNINITTNGIFRFLPVANSPIDASSQRNVDGIVEIHAPDVNLSGSLLVLTSDFLDAEDSLQSPCSAQLAENLSSLVVIERAGVSSVFANDLQPSGSLTLTTGNTTDHFSAEPQAQAPNTAQPLVLAWVQGAPECPPATREPVHGY